MPTKKLSNIKVTLEGFDGVNNITLTGVCDGAEVEAKHKKLEEWDLLPPKDYSAFADPARYVLNLEYRPDEDDVFEIRKTLPSAERTAVVRLSLDKDINFAGLREALGVPEDAVMSTWVENNEMEVTFEWKT